MGATGCPGRYRFILPTGRAITRYVHSEYWLPEGSDLFSSFTSMLMSNISDPAQV